MNVKSIAGWFALSALVAVVLAPPEAYGSGRMFLIVSATVAFLIAATEGAVPTRYLVGGVVGSALLLGHSLWLSLDPYRSVEFFGLAWAYYCVFGFFYFFDRDLTPRVTLTLVLLAMATSIYGVYQSVWGLDQMYQFVLSSGSPEVVKEPILGRVESARVFSTFALPGTLWGFLIMALPLHVKLWKPGRRVANGCLMLSASLVLTAAALTRSYGFVLGLFALSVGWFWTEPGRVNLSRRNVKALVLVALLMAPLLGGVYAARSETHNPVSLRLQNWLTAWEIFAAHPLGSGLNAYGILYPQHKQLEANETQFAHNTPLQLLAELGIFGVVGGAAGVFYLTRKRPKLAELLSAKRYVALAVAVWVVHNLVDINVYFGSLGTVGIALIGLLTWSGKATSESPRPESRARKRWLWATGLTAALVLVVSGGIYLSSELLFRAKIEAENQQPEQAFQTLTVAVRINPFDSSIYHEAGQIALELYHRDSEPDWLRRSSDHFQRAATLSPRKVGPHIGLALCLSTAGRTEEAIQQLEIAQTLDPSNSQVSGIRRLVEQRQAETSRKSDTQEIQNTRNEGQPIDTATDPVVH